MLACETCNQHWQRQISVKWKTNLTEPPNTTNFASLRSQCNMILEFHVAWSVESCKGIQSTDFLKVF